jgi:hypothetical protein
MVELAHGGLPRQVCEQACATMSLIAQTGRSQTDSVELASSIAVASIRNSSMRRQKKV